MAEAGSPAEAGELSRPNRSSARSNLLANVRRAA